jgi:hypothetical protein
VLSARDSEGVQACSLGREPQVEEPGIHREPRRGDGSLPRRVGCRRPFGALGIRFPLPSWSLRPRLHAWAPSEPFRPKSQPDAGLAPSWRRFLRPSGPERQAPWGRPTAQCPPEGATRSRWPGPTGAVAGRIRNSRLCVHSSRISNPRFEAWRAPHRFNSKNLDAGTSGEHPGAYPARSVVQASTEGRCLYVLSWYIDVA